MKSQAPIKKCRKYTKSAKDEKMRKRKINSRNVRKEPRLQGSLFSNIQQIFTQILKLIHCLAWSDKIHLSIEEVNNKTERLRQYTRRYTK